MRGGGWKTFGAAFVAGLAVIALIWTGAVWLTPPDDTRKLVDWQFMAALGVFMALIGAVVNWALLAVLVRLGRLSLWSALASGAVLGLLLTVVLVPVATERSWGEILVLWGLVGIYPIAGAWGGWVVRQRIERTREAAKVF